MFMVTLNPRPPKIIFILLLLLFIIITFFSCSPQRKIIKAEQLVITNPQAFDKIGKKWQLLNPCANDTTFTIKGDTLTLRDTLYKPKTDTLKGDTILIKQIKIVTKTIVQSIVDRQKQKLNQDSINNLNVESANLKGQLLSKNKEVSDANKRTNKWITWFIIAILIIIGSNGYFVISKFK